MSQEEYVEEIQRERIIEAIKRIRCGAADTEETLHMRVAQAMEKAGLDARHEVVLAPRCRIDFMVDDLGIEIKKNRPVPAKLKAQLARYAACPQVGELLVVAPRGVYLPGSIGGKRVTMIALERLWGISLP